MDQTELFYESENDLKEKQRKEEELEKLKSKKICKFCEDDLWVYNSLDKEERISKSKHYVRCPYWNTRDLLHSTVTPELASYLNTFSGIDSSLTPDNIKTVDKLIKSVSSKLLPFYNVQLEDNNTHYPYKQRNRSVRTEDMIIEGSIHRFIVYLLTMNNDIYYNHKLIYRGSTPAKLNSFNYSFFTPSMINDIYFEKGKSSILNPDLGIYVMGTSKGAISRFPNHLAELLGDRRAANRPTWVIFEKESGKYEEELCDVFEDYLDGVRTHLNLGFNDKDTNCETAYSEVSSSYIDGLLD